MRSDAIENGLRSSVPGETWRRLITWQIRTDAELNLRPKTATASFRLDESALKSLQEDARKQNVSVNTMFNQLLLTYANYDRPMKRFHMLKLPASSFMHLLQAATNETVIEAGNSAGNDVPKTYIRAKWGELTAESVLDYLRTTADHTNLFEYSEVIRGGRISVTLSHDFGVKGSLFLQSYVQAIFELLGKQPRFMQDENAVSFELQ